MIEAALYLWCLVVGFVVGRLTKGCAECEEFEAFMREIEGEEP